MIVGVLSLGLLWSGCTQRQVSVPSDTGPEDASGLSARDASGATDHSACAAPWKYERECTKDDAGGWSCHEKSTMPAGLPLGGEQWKCHGIQRPVEFWDYWELHWVCYGHVALGALPPAGCGFACEKIDHRADRDDYRCVKPDGPEDIPDVQPGVVLPFPNCKMAQDADCLVCEKGSAVGGTVCRWPYRKPHSWGPPGHPGPDDRCIPGATYWCDASTLHFDGWGQVTCKPDGSWPTVKDDRASGRRLDCALLTEPRRPDNLCGCYHSY